MKVVVCNEPGTLEMAERPIPTRKTNEVLIRIQRVGICGTDMHIFRGTQPFLTYPRVMGHELSGEVVEAPNGSSLHAGDMVYVMPYISCGNCVACNSGKPNCCSNIQVLGVHRDGGLAEYLALPESFVFKVDGISYDEAAMLEFLAIGAHAVRRGNVQKDQRVLVVGAGPIGLAAMIFSKLRGAHVTALDSREDRLNFCRDVLKIDHIVCVGENDEKRLSDITNGNFYDVVFDATGNPRAMERGFNFIAHGGHYVLISVVRDSITFFDPDFHKRETTLLGSRNATMEDFEAVVEAMRKGLIPSRQLNTHRATLDEFPARLEEWIDPASGVIKAIVEN